MVSLRQVNPLVYTTFGAAATAAAPFLCTVETAHRYLNLEKPERRDGEKAGLLAMPACSSAGCGGGGVLTGNKYGRAAQQTSATKGIANSGINTAPIRQTIFCFTACTRVIPLYDPPRTATTKKRIETSALSLPCGSNKTASQKILRGGFIECSLTERRV